MVCLHPLGGRPAFLSTRLDAVCAATRCSTGVTWTATKSELIPFLLTAHIRSYPFFVHNPASQVLPWFCVELHHINVLALWHWQLVHRRAQRGGVRDAEHLSIGHDD